MKKYKTGSVKNCQQGFTVVELLVVVGLISLLSVGIFALFRGARRGQTRSTDDLQMQSMMLSTQNELLRIIRQGQHFILPRLGEDSSTLCFIDKISDIKVLVPVKDEILSARADKELFKLMEYRVDMNDFDPANPDFDDLTGKKVSDHIEKIVFRLTSANAVSIKILFATEHRQLEFMFEGGLMNAGTDE